MTSHLPVANRNEASLPLYFVHLQTSDGVETDDDGLDLPDVETAYLEACEAIPSMSSDFIAQGRDPLCFSFVIVNEVGQTLIEVPFTERLRKDRPPARPGQHRRARHLSKEIAEAIDSAKETIRKSRAILARSQAA